jgi:hypothetical protein
MGCGASAKSDHKVDKAEGVELCKGTTDTLPTEGFPAGFADADARPAEANTQGDLSDTDSEPHMAPRTSSKVSLNELNQESAVPAEEIDPAKYVPPGQTVFHSGILMKRLDARGKAWDTRKFWITSGGGFFTSTPDAAEAVGLAVTDITASILEEAQEVENRFPFQLTSGGEFGGKVVLAATAEEDRTLWLECLAKYKELNIQGSGIQGIFHSAGIQGNRRRISQTNYDEMPRNACPADWTSERSVRSAASRDCFTPASVPHVSEAQSEQLEMTIGCDGEELELPKPGKRRPNRDSQVFWNEKSHTTIVLDFDDTLFPTTWVKEDLKLNWKLGIGEQLPPSPERTEIESLLERLSDRVDEFLHTATELAHVVLVTLASRPWVDIACDHFMPKLGASLKNYAIPIIYAREHITEEMKVRFQENVFRTATEEAVFWMKAKANAMRDAMEQQFSYADQSWKNVLSIGDSTLEQIGLVKCADEYMKQPSHKNADVVQKDSRTSEIITEDGHRKRLRVKTVKMLDEPTCDEMLAQVYLIKGWLPHIVNLDAGIDVIIPSSDDNDGLNELNKTVTGEEGTYEWLALTEL